MTTAVGYLSRTGVGKESVYGTAVNCTQLIPALTLGEGAQWGIAVLHLGLGAGQLAERLPMAEHAPLVALLVLADAAEEAVPAGGAEAAADAVADRDLRHVVTRRHDRADELVAEREPLLQDDPAVVEVQVGAADAGGVDAHDRVVGRDQLGLGLVFDLDLGRALEGDGAHQPPQAIAGAS